MTDLQWARISDDAFNAALFAYLAAMVGLLRATWRSGASALWTVARAVAVAGPGGAPRLDRGPGLRGRPGAVGQHVRVLGPCWRCSWSLGYLVIVEGVYKVRTLGGFALMFGVLTMAVAVSFLYVGPGPLVPALNSYWIKIHVFAAIGGSSLFALGAACSRSCTWSRTGVERRQVGGAPRRRRRRRSWAGRSTSTGRRPRLRRRGRRARAGEPPTAPPCEPAAVGRGSTGWRTASSRSRSRSGRSR